MARAIVNHPRVANGGTTAPARAARSLTSGLGNATVVKRAAPKSPYDPNAHPSAGLKAAAGAISGANFSGVTAGAPAPQANAQPFSSAYELTKAGAEKQLEDTRAGLAYKKTATESEYGLDPGSNDYATNPYSRAALLEQSYQRANRGSVNSGAASGQLYAGSTQNSQGYNRDARDLEHNNLSSSYQKALNAIREEGTAAENLEREKIAEAGWKRLEASENAALEPEASPEGAPASGSGAKKKKQQPAGAKRWAAVIKKKGK